MHCNAACLRHTSPKIRMKRFDGFVRAISVIQVECPGFLIQALSFGLIGGIILDLCFRINGILA